MVGVSAMNDNRVSDDSLNENHNSGNSFSVEHVRVIKSIFMSTITPAHTNHDHTNDAQ